MFDKPIKYYIISAQNPKRRLLLIFTILFMFGNTSSAQDVATATIEQCYQWAERNYPLVDQLDLIDRSTEFNIQNAAKSQLPQIGINGQFSYQSAVTEFPVKLPNIEVEPISKDQYKIYADIYQPVTSSPHIKSKKQAIEASAKIEKKQIEVELYRLRERINQLYFGILLIDSKSEQIQLLQDDINNATKKAESAVANGTATVSNVQLLQAESINAHQKHIELQAQRSAYVEMLSAFTAQSFSDKTLFSIPKFEMAKNEINRPEMALFDLQHQSLDLQQDQINNRIIPNLGLFLQGGYGRPALNFLQNEFQGYYIGGLRFNWNLSSLYNSKNDKQLISLGQQKIQNQKEVFLLNTAINLKQTSAEAQKYATLISSDEELIRLRESIKTTAEAQLENGLITALDYINYLNAENNARQGLATHRIQLLMTQYNQKTLTGN